jgi:TPP-dependent pyruvate/acetoin dehydrogenase alpha subunit
LIADTFRMGGHATHDEREARATFDASLFEYWGKRDPIGLFETFLIGDSVDLETGRRVKRTDGLRQRNAEVLRHLEERVVNEVERAAEEALVSGRERMPRGQSAADGVYAEAEREVGVGR